MEIQKELLPAGNSPTPALCHHQQQGIQLPGHPSLCSLGIGREIAPKEGCSLAAASLLLARLPWLRSRDLDELSSPAWGQQCFDRLRAFSSAGSLAVPLCDWKHFPAHRLLGKKKYPKTRGFVRRGRDGGADGSINVWAKGKESPSCASYTASKTDAPIPGTALVSIYRITILSHIKTQAKPYFSFVHRGRGKTGGGPAYSHLGAKE